MDYFPATSGFADALSTANLEIKMAMLQFSQKIRQYQLDCIQAEMASYEAATKHQKSPREMAQSQKLQLDLVGHQYAGLLNYWTGLTQVMLQGTTQMAMAVQQCGANTTQRLREKTGLPAMPDYMQSAIDAGMGYSLANLEASQRYAMNNAHAVLDSDEAHTANGNGTSKYSRSGTHVKHNTRHATNGAAA